MKLKFLGPVCWYDMVRAARRGRYFLVRCLYALALVCVLCLTYVEAIGLFETAVRPQRLASFGEDFFDFFMATQFLLAQILTPAYVAGAIAEEKERKTLEFLLATDLQGQEIVFSKLVSRVGNLLLFLLAGLPVLSLIQLFGGVSPQLLWCGFGATGMMILSSACLSILISVYVKKARDAIVRTTMLILAYYLVGFLLWALYMTVQGSDVLTSKLAYADMTLGEKSFAWFFELFLTGHIFFAVARAFGAPDFSGLGWAATPPDVLRRYAIFHSSAALLFLGWACWRLRAVFVKQNYGTPLQAPKAGKGRFGRRPPVGERPMLWKERHVEAASRMTKGAVFFYLLTFILALTPLGFIGYFLFFTQVGFRTDFDEVMQTMNVYVRLAGSAVAVLLLLGIGVRAASGVSVERERQTLDSLLASPLSLREILAGKWLGAVLGAKWMFFLLLFIWGLGLATGGLHFLALPALLAALACYAAFIASLGVYFSVTAKTTNRAILWTVGLLLFWGGGHWLCCGSAAAIVTRSEHVLMLFSGFTPPFVLGFFAFTYRDVDRLFDREAIYFLVMFSILGLIFSGVAAGLLWAAARNRFAAVSGRIPAGYRPSSKLMLTHEED